MDLLGPRALRSDQTARLELCQTECACATNNRKQHALSKLTHTNGSGIHNDQQPRTRSATITELQRQCRLVGRGRAS